MSAYYCDDPELAQRDVAAGFLLDEDGEYHYMASAQLDPIDARSLRPAARLERNSASLSRAFVALR
jgi:hypothetical protein